MLRNMYQSVDAAIDTVKFEESFPRYTHYLFRYPAKFHPPVARYLIKNFSAPEELVIDPFCGSGTLLVEGALLGRKMFGVDLDPVAAFISKVKSTPLQKNDEADLAMLQRRINERLGPPVALPAIPNINHWFEPHVLDEMCSLLGVIDSTQMSGRAYNFSLAVFLGRVRAWSNADPVPVSGLEVTSHIKAKRATGHYPDVLGGFLKVLDRALTAAKEYRAALPKGRFVPVIAQSEALAFMKYGRRLYDAIITSPPYLSAVDYYRRHTLEMYWLNRSLTKYERVRLRHCYIGQYSVTSSMVEAFADVPLSRATEEYLNLLSDPQRVNSGRHYFKSMATILRASASRLKEGGKLVLVVGDGLVGRTAIPTGKLLVEEVSTTFKWIQTTQYPLKNRYMTYSRRNGADIGYESIIELRKK